MSEEKISIKVGPPVEGKDFFGREEELQYAWDNYIMKGMSLLLSAPRRVGKSSFAKKMLKQAEEKGWKTLYLNLEGIGTESEFVKLFKQKFIPERRWDKVGNFFFKLFDSIKTEKGWINSDVLRNNTYVKMKKLIEKEKEILIVIDELTIYLNHLLEQGKGKERVEFFLEWLRSFRQESGTKVSWIFCSSVGIENFVSMHQLSKHINDIQPLDIGPFKEDEARSFITRLEVNEKIHFTEEHINYILEKLVWLLPFFIQMLVEKIYFLVSTENNNLSNDTIDEAYNRLIAGEHFNTWDERLSEYKELETHARLILNLCASNDGASREKLLANLTAQTSRIEKPELILAKALKMLQNDGYLAAHNGNYIFVSPLLKDFWHYRFIK